MNTFNAINETLYLLSVPGMRESIREGMKTGLDECNKDELRQCYMRASEKAFSTIWDNDEDAIYDTL